MNYDYLIGLTREELKEKLVLSPLVRVLEEGQGYTADYNPNRLNVMFKGDKVESVWWG